MNIDLSNLGDRLTKRNEALNIINKILSGMTFPYPPENISLELSALVVSTYAEANIDVIYKYATSSVEIVFLNAILIFALTKGVFFLSMMGSLNSAIEKIQIMRNSYYISLQMWNWYQEQTGDKSMNAFIGFVNNTPLSENAKDQIKRDMLGNIHDIYNTFFFSIKSNFQESSSNNKKIETDIFVWTISDPQFRLLIECDELDYYQDKSTFSSDRARDRLLQSEGYQVLRFSSQEVISNPLGKAQELVNYLENRRVRIVPEM